jgi:hypothetical protein
MQEPSNADRTGPTPGAGGAVRVRRGTREHRHRSRAGPRAVELLDGRPFRGCSARGLRVGFGDEFRRVESQLSCIGFREIA